MTKNITQLPAAATLDGTEVLPAIQAGADVKATASALAAPGNVRLTGDQSVAGVKTFANPPVVPDGSWSIADTSGLQTALNTKAADADVVHDTGPESIAGVKTFSNSPVVPDASWTVAKTSGLQASLDGKLAVTTAASTYVRSTERPRSPMQPTYGGAFTAANVAAALVGGAAVDLPPGTCVGTIAVPGGAVLRGVPGKTILQAAAGAGTNVITDAGTGAFTVEDVVIDGNKSNVTSGATTTGNGVYVTTSPVVLRRCILRNTRHDGFQASSVDDVVIDNCDFVDCGDSSENGTFRTNGVTVHGHRYEIANCRMDGTAGMGIAAAATAAGQVSGLRLIGNRILDSGLFGIALGSFATDCDILGNWIDGCTDNCIDTGSARFIKVQNNTCLNGLDGIDIDMTALVLTEDEVGIKISGNRIKECGRYGIVVFLPTSASGVSITDNHIDNTDAHGISTSNLWNAVITGNTIRNFGNGAAGFAGIQIDGDSQHNLISHNNVWEDRVSPQGYGYFEYGGGTYGYETLTGNDFSRTGVPYGAGSAGAGPNTGDIRLGNR